ncbi:MAG: hypothetical protein L0H23_09305 [Luteimonas sp.]|nr:hypothetical protein [Luteimonas sp.]
MKIKQCMTIVLMALVCQACMAFPPSRGEGKAGAAEAGVTGVAVSFASLPSMVLARDARETKLREGTIPEGWQMRRGMAGALMSPAGRKIIEGSEAAPLVGAEMSPDGGWLVHQGSGRYVVYDRDGHRMRSIPMFEIRGAGSLLWQWKDSSSLVGVVEVSNEDEGPRYPDSDILPTETFFVLYRLDEDGGTLYALKAPEPPPGTVLRLEGVTLQGALILSAVLPEEYFGGMPEQRLGAYDVE